MEKGFRSEYHKSTRDTGNEVVWVDIDSPIIIRTAGPNIPVLTAINGNLLMPIWQVGDFSMCESQEFIHQWQEGSPVFWHVHMTTNGTDTTDRYIRLRLEFGYSTPNGVWVFPALMDSGDILIPANTPAKTMSIASIGSFTPTGVKIGGHVVARLERIAATGTAPTANVFIPMLQLHVACDSDGSRLISSK